MNPKVLILMGSESDWAVMKEAYEILRRFEVGVHAEVASAHRTPEKTKELAENARSNGVKVLIAGAGAAAHLPGVIAAYTDLPVIGVPIASTPLAGTDALYAIVQMPKGIPVATVAINGATNAGILALEILSVDSGPDGALAREKLLAYRTEMKRSALEKKLPI
jgi:5-(carboxyamino)imidazole ribonucleotide mutase